MRLNKLFVWETMKTRYAIYKFIMTRLFFLDQFLQAQTCNCMLCVCTVIIYKITAKVTFLVKTKTERKHKTNELIEKSYGSSRFLALLWSLKLLMIERFLNDCRKTKTKAIIPANHNRSKQRDEPIRIPGNWSVTCSKRGKNHAYMARLVLVLLLIG